jgi:hypothetical protein
MLTFTFHFLALKEKLFSSHFYIFVQLHLHSRTLLAFLKKGEYYCLRNTHISSIWAPNLYSTWNKMIIIFITDIYNIFHQFIHKEFKCELSVWELDACLRQTVNPVLLRLHTGIRCILLDTKPLYTQHYKRWSTHCNKLYISKYANVF